MDDPKYAAAARKAADFVWDKLRDHHGRLLKRYRQGEAALPAHVEDYAFMVWGLLELYDATFEIDYLKKAIALNELMLDYFWDKKNGGLFFTADSLEDVLVRTKEIYDGAIPSGNSVAALNLVRLGRITANPELEEKASAIGQAFSEQVKRAPMGHTQLMSALTFMFGPSYEVVVAGETNEKDTDAMLTALQQEYFPNKVTLFRPTEKESPAIADIAEFTKTQKSLNGKATAYVCKNYACNAPTTEIDEMLGQLKSGQN